MKTVVIASPRRNALSTGVMKSLLAGVRAAKDEPILLRGEGDTFSAGLDLKEVVDLDVAGMTTFLDTLEELVSVLYEHPAPVVAWVNGHAIAGGCILAMCCDLRFLTARPGVRIGLNEVPLGLRFPPVTFQMATRRLPAAALERVVLEGALYEADAARALGLVDAIGEEPDALAALQKLASHPPHAYAAAKRALRGRLEVSELETRRFREEVIPEWVSPALKERLRSVLKK